MAIEFSHSMRSLLADGPRRTIWGLCIAAALLGVWGMWFFRARVTLYDVSARAHLEVDGAVSIEAIADGQITAVRAANREVRASEVLFDLDTGSQLLHVRAPIAGQFDSRELRVGTHVHSGERLGTIIPSGELKVVAEFSQQEGLGHIRPGQAARVRVDGLAFNHYSDIAAIVKRVANQSYDGLVPVELLLDPGLTSVNLLRHGLPVTVEVEVDQASPATLVLRAVGQVLAMPGSDQVREAQQ